MSSSLVVIKTSSNCVVSPHEALIGYDFSPVDVDELGFALTLFVAAANRKLALRKADGSTLQKTSLLECQQLFVELSADADATTGTGRAAHASETTLPVAFAALWQHYRFDGFRHSICARVLGFYYLMEQTGGRAIDGYLELSPTGPEAVLLHPAVVEGLANVSLNLDGLLSASLLRAAIEHAAASTVLS